MFAATAALPLLAQSGFEEEELRSTFPALSLTDRVYDALGGLD